MVHSEGLGGYIWVHGGTFGYIRVHSHPLRLTAGPGKPGDAAWGSGSILATTLPLYKTKGGTTAVRLCPSSRFPLCLPPVASKLFLEFYSQCPLFTPPPPSISSPTFAVTKSSLHSSHNVLASLKLPPSISCPAAPRRQHGRGLAPLPAGAPRSRNIRNRITPSTEQCSE